MLSTMQRLQRIWPIIFFALLPLLPLWRCVFLGQAIGPFDEIRQMAPWNGPSPDQPWDVLQADSVLQFYPWRDMVFDSWGHGQMPLWNPYELAGYPLLANSQSGGLYPPHVLIGVSHLPTALGITLLAWFHLAWAGLGVYFLARRLGANRVGATVGGASFALSTFMLAWTALPSVIETCSWIPWMLAAIFWLFESEKRLRPFALLALSTGMMFLAGHLQFCAYGLMAATLALLALGIAKLKTGKAALLLGVGAMALGGLIAAPQLIPVLDYSKFSHRKTAPTEIGYQAYVGNALQLWEASTVALPNDDGNPRTWATSEAGRTSAYWPQYVKPGANFAESAICIGLLVFALMVRVPWRSRKLWPIAAVGLLALLIAFGTPLNRLLYFGVPGWSASGSPARIEVLFVMCGCALAALGFRNFEESNRANFIRHAVLVVLAAIFILTILIAPELPEQVAFVWDSSRALARSSMLLGAITALLVLFGLHTRNPKTKMFAVAAPILIGTFYIFNIVPTGHPLEPVQIEPNARIAAINGHWGLFGPPKEAILPPNTASLSRAHELGGYDSLLHNDTVQYLKSVNRMDPAPPENGNMMFIKPSVDSKRLAESGVTEVWQRAPDGSVVKTPIAGPGRASTPIGTAQITQEDYQSVTAKASGPGLLTLRDRNMPGWGVQVDGKAAELKGTLWREVDLSAGDHTVVFNYQPRGPALWPLTVILIVGLLGVIVRRPAGQDA